MIILLAPVPEHPPNSEISGLNTHTTKEALPFSERASVILCYYGRDERIRTSDPLHPMQMR